MYTEGEKKMNENQKEINQIQNMVLAAIFLAFGLILPSVTMQMQAIGQMLSPMHLPVLLCGLVCGTFYGAVVGILTPLLRSVLFGMPPLYPVAIAMSFELLCYGLVAGLLYKLSPWKCILAVYKALIPAMILGRIIGGLATAILLSLNGKGYSLAVWATAYFVKTVPGIILQLILIPAIMVALGRAHLIVFHWKGEKASANEV